MIGIDFEAMRWRFDPRPLSGETGGLRNSPR